MKKNVLIFAIALTTGSLIIFGFNNQNNAISNTVTIADSKPITLDKKITTSFNFNFFPDFFYDIGTRFQGIKKDNVDKAISVHDFLPKEEIQSIVSYKSVSVIILEDSKQTDVKATGTSEILTDAQVKLLRSADYSTNILIKADYQKKDEYKGTLYDGYSTPHFTIAPEKHAVYESGKNGLIQYLKENSRLEVSIVKKNKLQPGKLFFTVTKNGVISNVKLGTTSGHSTIDQKMMELIYKAPEKWQPAENSKGEKVDQELVFFFGAIGC